MKITIVGAGNVAWHLGHAFKAAGHKITGIRSRTKTTGEELAKELKTSWRTDLTIPPGSCDILVLAVSDSALQDVIERLEVTGAVVVHTAGSIPMESLNRFDRFGVFYPFQTLTKGIPVDFQQVPLCVEASGTEIRDLLLKLAGALSDRVCVMDSEQRKKLHLAGIFLSNFTNHLVTLATDYAKKNGLDPELLYPLLQETMEKLLRTAPETAQTGPARRKDISVIREHLDMLSEDPQLKNLYSLITDSIIAYYSRD